MTFGPGKLGGWFSLAIGHIVCDVSTLRDSECGLALGLGMGSWNGYSRWVLGWGLGMGSWDGVLDWVLGMGTLDRFEKRSFND